MLESKSRRAEAAGPEPGPVASATRDNGNYAVVGIGASAGGLEAFSKLVDGLPPQSGMAFILVQHLDPTHESMMVELLASHTLMNVRQATDGMQVAPDHLYLIPPGTYLSVDRGRLHLSQPKARHGARLPFDFLLHSLAEEYGSRTIAVVLSGTGADGSLALKAIKEKGGLVVAQEPVKSAYDGMPRGAIMTGTVDLVLPVTEIADALVTYCRRMNLPGEPNGAGPDRTKTPDLLPADSRTAVFQNGTRFSALQTWNPATPDRAANGNVGGRTRRHGTLSRTSHSRRK